MNLISTDTLRCSISTARILHFVQKMVWKNLKSGNTHIKLLSQYTYRLLYILGLNSASVAQISHIFQLIVHVHKDLT